MSEKLTALQGLLKSKNLSGIVIEKQANFSWLTGGRGFIGLASENACGCIIVTTTGAIALSNNIESQRLADEEFTSLPSRDFLWYDESVKPGIVRELAGENVMTDTQLAPWFQTKRTTLDATEQKNYRFAGKHCAKILEQAVAATKPGMTEFALAGDISAGLWSAGIEPITLLIAFDERIQKYRHPLPTANALKHHVMAAICGRYKGLIVSVTRMAHIGKPPANLIKKYQAALTANARAINATRPGETMDGIFAIIKNTYAETGCTGEERLHHQGGLTGYVARENRAMPGLTATIEANQAYAWNPSVTGAKCEDTILVLQRSNEIITHTGSWNYMQCEGLLLPDMIIV